MNSNVTTPSVNQDNTSLSKVNPVVVMQKEDGSVQNSSSELLSVKNEFKNNKTTTNEVSNTILDPIGLLDIVTAPVPDGEFEVIDSGKVPDTNEVEDKKEKRDEESNAKMEVIEEEIAKTDNETRGEIVAGDEPVKKDECSLEKMEVEKRKVKLEEEEKEKAKLEEEHKKKEEEQQELLRRLEQNEEEEAVAALKFQTTIVRTNSQVVSLILVDEINDSDLRTWMMTGTVRQN